MVRDSSDNSDSSPGGHRLPENRTPEVLYSGYVADAELAYSQFRHWNSALGVWLLRGPAGYIDGANLFTCAGGDPAPES